MSKIPASHLIFFIWFFIGTYVASYLVFLYPFLTPPGVLGFISVITTIPSLFFFYRWTGWRTTLIVFGILVCMVTFIEGVGVLTGFPYGSFYYTDTIGIKLFGVVPWTIAFAFIPLLLGALGIITYYVNTPWKVILLTASYLVLIDLVLDPVFVHLGIWVWITPGIYYGVPVSNFIGWFATGLITTSMLLTLLKWRQEDTGCPSILIAISLVLTMGFWSGYALWAGLVIPFALSLIILGFLIFSMLRFWSTD
jgi:putative membrane protein